MHSAVRGASTIGRYYGKRLGIDAEVSEPTLTIAGHVMDSRTRYRPVENYARSRNIAIHYAAAWT
jgi:hypothetical protein